MYQIISFICVFVLVASSAAAQVLQPPPRSTGKAPDHTRQQLTAQGSLLGGYEDNILPINGGDAIAPDASRYTAFGDARLTYSIGNAARSLEANGSGYRNSQRNAGATSGYGLEQSLRGRTYLDGRTEIALSEQLRYAPQFSLGLFDAVQTDQSRSNSENPTNALSERGSWTRAASASVVRQWTRRMSTDAGYAFSNQRYVHGGVFDSRMNSATLGYTQAFGRSFGIRGTYSYQNAKHGFEHAEGAVPILTRATDVGFTYQRRLSASRGMSFSGGSGASHVDTIEQTTRTPMQYWTPSGYGTVRLDVARSWSLAADYRRSTTVLQGRTPEPFTAHTAQASVGGNARRWLESVFSLGYSNGVAGAQTRERPLGRYDGYIGSAQVRVRMAAGWSSVVTLTHFQYRLNNEASESLGVSRELQRNSVRVGLAWSLPLYATR